MQLLQTIEAIRILENGQVFVDCWGPELLIDPEDWGGIEILSDDVKTASIGPWLGTNGDDKYKVFCLSDNRLVEYSKPPLLAKIRDAQLLPSLRPSNIIPFPGLPDPDEVSADEVAVTDNVGTGTG